MNKGYSLITVIIFTFLMTLSFSYFSQMLNQIGKWQRGLASNNDLDSMTTLFKLLTDTKEACAKSGLIGIDISSLVQPTPTPIPVTIKFPNGTTVFQAGGKFGEARKIKDMNIVKAEQIGDASSHMYFGTLLIQTELTGQGNSLKNPNRAFYLRLITDTENKITSCTSSSGSVLDSPAISNVQNCPQGYSVKSIDFVNQTVTCKLSHGGQYLIITGDVVGSPYCYTGNPVTGNCSCPSTHVARHGIALTFSSGNAGNLGNNFACTGNCTFQFEVCSEF